MSDRRDIFSVSRLNRDIGLLLQSNFPAIWLEGEISNLARPASGHLYFSLKDGQAQVRAAMFRNQSLYLRFKPANGMQVLVRARVSLYEPRGEFQIIIEHMEEAGDGALQREFEVLKAKLATEGLFDLAHKKPLPAFPQRIGVITSPSGAAIRDVISVLQRRWPMLDILIYPVAVQGADAAKEIVQALSLATKRAEVDALLLVRGGGSLEDLQAFNNESVARSIAACELPIICGVGHEIDYTIADLVADQRAPTPSAGAELISPDQQELLSSLSTTESKLQNFVITKIKIHQQQLFALQRNLTLLHPLKKIQQQFQKLDNLESRLYRSQQLNLSKTVMLLSQLRSKLIHHSPQNLVARYQQKTMDLLRHLNKSTQQILAQKQQVFNKLLLALDTVSPLATLQRGYAIVNDSLNNKAITDPAQTRIGDTIAITLHKGHLQAKVTNLNQTNAVTQSKQKS